MEYVTLQNGLKMPKLGFGVYQMRDLEECEEAVVHALKTGYRLIDTAAVYGNEEAVGKGIKRSGVAREDIFLTTKLWVQDVSYEGAKEAFEASLKRLDVDYIDLYLIHQPYGDINGAWRAMEELYKAGKIKAIGVSNFAADRLVDFSLTNKIVPMVNQVEFHPFNQQESARKIMEKYAIQVEGWAPFAEGQHDLFSNETLQKIADKHKKTIAQVVLRWHMQLGIVAIPKSVHPERIEENFNIFDFELDAEDITTIDGLDENKVLFVIHDDPEMVEVFHSRKIHD